MRIIHFPLRNLKRFIILTILMKDGKLGVKQNLEEKNNLIIKAPQTNITFIISNYGVCSALTSF